MERWTEFEKHVRAMLELWGQEFALHRDCEYLGHQSKNMLQVMIEHRGEMPARAVGFKPLEVNQDALLIERAITDLAKANPEAACVMRAMYCGRGRRGEERVDTARDLLRRTTGRRLLSRRQYYALHETGTDFVERWIRLIAIAA